MFYYTYVLECINNNSQKDYYVGYCKDLRKRIQTHQNKTVFATKKYYEVKLIYYEACINKTDARIRELQLKTGFGRGYVKKRLRSYLQSGIS